MKHLKPFNLFELHSSTYISAADKMRGHGDSSKARDLEDMAKFRKYQEEMTGSPEDKRRRDKRTAFRIFEQKYPLVLKHLNVTNWRELRYNSLEDIIVNSIDTILLKIALEYGVDPNTVYDYKPLLFHTDWILDRKDLEKSKLLLEYGAEPNSKDSVGESFILKVLKSGHSDYRSQNKTSTAIMIEYINLLLEYDPNLDFGGCVKYISDQKILDLIGDRLKSDINDLDSDGRNVLFSCKTELIKDYINSGVKIDVIDNNGYNLSFSNKWRLKEILEYMKPGTELDFNHKNNDGYTPLGVAIKNNDDSLVKYLLSNYDGSRPSINTDPNLKYGKLDMSPIEALYSKKMSASANYRIDDMFASFIRSGIDINIDPKKPFIFHALQYNLRKSIYSMINRGYDIHKDITKYRGKTAFEYAQEKKLEFYFK